MRDDEGMGDNYLTGDDVEATAPDWAYRFDLGVLPMMVLIEMGRALNAHAFFVADKHQESYTAVRDAVALTLRDLHAESVVEMMLNLRTSPPLRVQE